MSVWISDIIGLFCINPWWSRTIRSREVNLTACFKPADVRRLYGCVCVCTIYNSTGCLSAPDALSVSLPVIHRTLLNTQSRKANQERLSFCILKQVYQSYLLSSWNARWPRRILLLVSHDEYANWTDRQTDRRQTVTLCFPIDATGVAMAWLDISHGELQPSNNAKSTTDLRLDKTLRFTNHQSALEHETTGQNKIKILVLLSFTILAFCSLWVCTASLNEAVNVTWWSVS